MLLQAYGVAWWGRPVLFLPSLLSPILCTDGQSQPIGTWQTFLLYLHLDPLGVPFLQRARLQKKCSLKLKIKNIEQNETRGSRANEGRAQKGNAGAHIRAERQLSSTLSRRARRDGGSKTILQRQHGGEGVLGSNAPPKCETKETR